MWSGVSVSERDGDEARISARELKSTKQANDNGDLVFARRTPSSTCVSWIQTIRIARKAMRDSISFNIITTSYYISK